MTIALDIDGVLAPSGLPAGWLPRSWNPEQFLVLHELYNLAVAAPVRDLLVELDARNDVQISWHTSWRESAVTRFAPQIGVGANWPQFATIDEYRDVSAWWKLAAVQRWLREHQNSPQNHLIWIDDDITDSIASGEITPELLANPQLTVLAPRHLAGLTPEDLSLLQGLVELYTASPDSV